MIGRGSPSRVRSPDSRDSSISMKRLAKRVFDRLVPSMLLELQLLGGTNFVNDEPAAQKDLMMRYRSLAALGRVGLPALADVGFHKYSQFEEDGILLFLFSIIPPVNRTCVEICAGNGRECMAANLIINHGWWGHLFDGSANNVEAGRRFFSNNRNTFFCPPQFTQAWITAENVNAVVAESGITGSIDLLSIDVDGMDYWLWNALDAVQPQVVVCETHNLIPPDQALTVPYDSSFVFSSEEYRGASLAAMTKLGQKKGYRLVGTHRYGFNAFFVKNGVAEDLLPGINPATCQSDPLSTRLRSTAWPRISQFKWQQV